MRRLTEFRVIIGGLIWIGCLSYLFLFGRHLTRQSEGTATEIGRYLTHRNEVIEVELEFSQVLRVGDPVFAEIDGMPELIGRIQQVESRESTEKHFVWTSTAFIELNVPVDFIHQEDHFVFHETPEDIGWVIETMLPQTTRLRINELVKDAYDQHHKAIMEAFRPLVEETLRESFGVIGKDLRAALRNRETALAKIGRRFKADLIDEKIIPLIKEEIWPIVRAESEPLVKEIGKDLWQEVSIWRFTWRAIYDATPLTNSNLTAREFKRFMDDKASPIMEEYVPDMVEVQQRILSKVSKNKTVEKVLGEAFRKVMNDEEVRAMAREIAQEIFIGNENLRAAIEKPWKSDMALEALEEANRRLDPTVVEIGALLFGAIDDEIAPDFAAILRNRIMRKDTRWFELKRGESNEPYSPTQPVRAAVGTGTEIFPGRIRESLLREREEQEEDAEDSDPTAPSTADSRFSPHHFSLGHPHAPGLRGGVA